MKKPTVEDVLKQGIYGAVETKPEERRKFLGTIRERIIIALYNHQVREKGIYPQVEEWMKKSPKAQLLLNGNLKYGDLSKYVGLAKKYKLHHKIVTDKEHNTDIGLVLAMDFAIDKEEIYISRTWNVQQKEKRSLLSKIFRKK